MRLGQQFCVATRLPASARSFTFMMRSLARPKNAHHSGFGPKLPLKEMH